jgi:CPA1 family monovalent cation:H+ antiporter
LIAQLGLADADRVNGEEEEARRVLLREAMVHLDRARARQRRKVSEGSSAGASASGAVFDEVAGLYQMRLNALPMSRHETGVGQVDPSLRRQVMLEALQVERATLIRLRNDGQIDDEVMRTLQRELDLAESRMYTGASHVH